VRLEGGAIGVEAIPPAGLAHGLPEFAAFVQPAEDALADAHTLALGEAALEAREQQILRCREGEATVLQGADDGAVLIAERDEGIGFCGVTAEA
jgi:hypothetical protein